MIKKIIGVFVCMLLIIFPIVSVTGNIIQDNIIFREPTRTYRDPNQKITNISYVMNAWSQQAKLSASDGAAADFFGCSVSLHSDYAVIGAYYDDTSGGSNAGSAYIFKRSGTSWMQEAKLTASDGAAWDNFGCSVSLDGDYAIIGAYRDDTSVGSDAGSAYVFKRSGTNWMQEAKLTASDSAANDNFGRSVSLDGDYAIIGAQNDDSYRGSAYVFKRSGTSWMQEAKLTASDGAVSDLFGCSVTIEGYYAIIGAWADDTSVGVDAGSAYVFKRSGTSWVQEAKLTASDGAYDEWFGYSVSLSGDYAIIGVNADDTSGGLNAGSAYVFKRSGTSWMQETKLTASDGAAYDQFGYSVSIDCDTAFIGASTDDTSSGEATGSAYVFKRFGTSWMQETKLTASDAAADDHFGYSVSIKGYYAIIGAYFDDNSFGSDAGSAYVFKKPIPDLECSGTLSWTDVSPGKTVTGQFLVANIGEPTSTLSWKIDTYPYWGGTWSFIPSSGSGLTPDMGAITVGVEVTAPNQQNQQFTGEIKIVNIEDSNDYDTISVLLKTPKNKPSCQIRGSQQYLNNLYLKMLKQLLNSE